MTIFAPTRSHRGPGHVYNAQQRAAGRASLDAFAEALAECGDTARAAAKCGVSASYGRVLLQKLRRSLGQQSA